MMTRLTKEQVMTQRNMAAQNQAVLAISLWEKRNKLVKPLHILYKVPWNISFRMVFDE